MKMYLSLSPEEVLLIKSALSLRIRSLCQIAEAYKKNGSCAVCKDVYEEICDTKATLANLVSQTL